MPSDDGLNQRVGLAHAQTIADILCTHPHIHQIFGFGSVMRDGVGNDIDLILITDEIRAQHFLNKCNVRLRKPQAMKKGPLGTEYRHPSRRLKIASEVLGRRFVSLSKRAQKESNLTRPGYLDIFIFPRDWRDRLAEIQACIPHQDPHFMQNIAHDAQLLCESED